MTGEHWAEKVVAEIGHLIDVDCANVELARCVVDQGFLFAQTADHERGHRDAYLGTICESFLPIDQGPDDPMEQEYYFFHGSEILQMVFEDYDTNVRFGQRDHNIKSIVYTMTQLMAVESMNPMPLWDKELKVLASYALLDGLVANTDRHHENWMVAYIIDQGNMWFEILPSFDHASSLGRELTDDRRERILRSDSMLSYLYKGRGGVFVDHNRKRALPPLRLAQLLCRWAPDFTRDTCERIRKVSDSEMRDTIHKVPPEFMSDIAKEFAYKVIITSRTELLRSVQ